MIVKTYVPADVAGVLGAVPDVAELPPHPIAPPATAMIRMASREIKRRRFDAIPSISTPARTAPPSNPQCPMPTGLAIAVLLAALVVTVKTLVPLPPAVRVTVGGARVQVGRLLAPAGDVVSVQVRSTVPEYVLPADRGRFTVPWAPGTIAGSVPPETTNGNTVTVDVPVSTLYVGSPE